MAIPLRVLIVADDPDDADLLVQELRRGGYEETAQRVEGAEGLRAAIDASQWDVVISAYTMPGFAGLDALRIVQERGLDVPFIFVSDTVCEEAVVDGLRAGAHDYVTMQRLVRLVPSIRRELCETEVRRERKRAEDERDGHRRSLTGPVRELRRLYGITGLIGDPGKLIDDVLAGTVELIPSGCQYPDRTCARITLDGREFASADFRETRLGLTADIVVSGEKRGAIEVCLREENPESHENPFLEEERDLIRDLARQLGAMVEHRRAEHDLEASETRYRRLFESAKDGILILDADSGQIVDANPFLTDLTGYSHTEFLGKRLWEIGPFRDITASQASFAALQTRGYVRYEDLPLETRDGRTVSVEFVSNVYRVDSQNVIQCNIRDITERKRVAGALQESEERYRALCEGAAEGILVADIETQRFRYANPAICSMLGYTVEELTTLGVAEIHPKESLGHVVAEFEAQARGEKTLAPGIPCLRKDGTVLYADITTALLVIGGRKCNVGFFSDITGRLQTKKALRDAEEQFRQSQKLEAIGRLAGGIAHDFNNMLGAIIGYSDIVLRDLRDEDPVAQDIEQIRKAADRAAALTKQLLAFSRKQVLEPRVINLNSVVTGIEKMLRRLIGEDLKFRTALTENLWRAKADPDQIDQVIMNLAVNARDAMPMGGQLTIETANVELDEEYARNHVAVTPGPHVMLAVSDTGCGMDEKTKERLFEPFFTTKEQGKGTGLGLSTVYGIVKQSGGNIWVYSEPGKGTTFKVYLPRVLADTEAIPAKAPEGKLHGTETVLVAKDEEVLRRLISRLLSILGYKVLEAANGGEALITCEKYERPIHLLVTDVVMPGMGGRELAQRLAEIRPGLKVLYTSGYTDDAIVHHGVLDPGTAFIQKPFTASGLAVKVRGVLDKGKGRQQ